jgi:hypothetical protein
MQQLFCISEAEMESIMRLRGSPAMASGYLREYGFFDWGKYHSMHYGFDGTRLAKKTRTYDWYKLRSVGGSDCWDSMYNGSAITIFARAATPDQQLHTSSSLARVGCLSPGVSMYLAEPHSVQDSHQNRYPCPSRHFRRWPCRCFASVPRDSCVDQFRCDYTFLGVEACDG